MNNKKAKIIVIISILFLSTLIGIYGYRFIHYYRIEHPKTEVETPKTLSQILTSHIVTTGDGLYQVQKEYYFKGNVTNNYINYSGNLFRIMGVNEDGTINVIANTSLTSLVWGYNQETFKESNIQKWLNEEYYKTLKNIDQYIVEKEYCIDTIKDGKKITCNQKESYKIGLLSLTDYQNALASKSYLNNQENYWLVNPKEDREIWYITSKGTVASTSDQILGVRPVFTMKGDITPISGDGTLDKPYVLEADSGTTLKEKEVGKYVSFSNQTWRIIEQTEGTKVALNGYITIKEEEVELEYSNLNNIFNPKRRNTLAYYLNNAFYQTLEKEKLIQGDWFIGTYGEENNYDYHNIKEKTVTSYVGLLKVTDLYINDYDGYSLLTAPEENQDTIYSVKKEGKLYEDSINTELKVRPAIVLNPDLTIVSGTGSVNDPYILN